LLKTIRTTARVSINARNTPLSKLEEWSPAWFRVAFTFNFPTRKTELHQDGSDFEHKMKATTVQRLGCPNRGYSRCSEDMDKEGHIGRHVRLSEVAEP